MVQSITSSPRSVLKGKKNCPGEEALRPVLSFLLESEALCMKNKTKLGLLRSKMERPFAQDLYTQSTAYSTTPPPKHEKSKCFGAKISTFLHCRDPNAPGQCAIPLKHRDAASVWQPSCFPISPGYGFSPGWTCRTKTCRASRTPFPSALAKKNGLQKGCSRGPLNP